MSKYTIPASPEWASLIRGYTAEKNPVAGDGTWIDTERGVSLTLGLESIFRGPWIPFVCHVQFDGALNQSYLIVGIGLNPSSPLRRIVVTQFEASFSPANQAVPQWDNENMGLFYSPNYVRPLTEENLAPMTNRVPNLNGLADVGKVADNNFPNAGLKRAQWFDGKVVFEPSGTVPYHWAFTRILPVPFELDRPSSGSNGLYLIGSGVVAANESTTLRLYGSVLPA